MINQFRLQRILNKYPSMKFTINGEGILHIYKNNGKIILTENLNELDRVSPAAIIEISNKEIDSIHIPTIHEFFYNLDYALYMESIELNGFGICSIYGNKYDLYYFPTNEVIIYYGATPVGKLESDNKITIFDEFYQ